MKPINIIIALFVSVWLFGVGWGVYRVYQSYTLGRDPLRAEKLELQRAEILRETEKERQKTEEQRRETLREQARIERQTKLESNAGVSWAGVALAFTWRMSFPILFFSGVIGAGVYLWRKPVLFEHGTIRSPVPRHEAAGLAREALAVEERKAIVEALAYAESVTRERMEQCIDFVRAVKPGRETVNISNALPAAAETPPQQAGNIPTFAEIFDSRELHGEMILGYEDEETPRLGKYEAVHSCLIYGLARSGKTSWLRGLIGQTILTEPETRCDVLDPHAARADSLLGSLPKTKHFHAIDAKDPIPALTAFGDELRRRLLSEEATFPPRILLIDELNQLASEPYKPQLAALCEATAQRGRKVNMFLLATAQDVREKKIGDFRASLSSAYFFKGKSAQVKAFLDDPEAAKLYRKHVTRHGVALFSAADEEPRLMMIPECKPNDLKRLELAENIQADALPVTPQTTNGETAINDTENLSEAIETTTAQKTGVVLPFRRRNDEETGKEREIKQETPFLSADTLRGILAEKIARNEETLSGIANKAGVSKGQLHRFLKEYQTPSENLLTALQVFARTPGTPANSTGTER